MNRRAVGRTKVVRDIGNRLSGHRYYALASKNANTIIASLFKNSYFSMSNFHISRMIHRLKFCGTNEPLRSEASEPCHGRTNGQIIYNV